MAYNETQQPRFSQGIARLHDVKGNPAPQITPEIAHGVTLDQVSFSYELEALLGRRNLFVGITAPAIAGVSAGIRLTPPKNGILVVTEVQVNKATAGFVTVQFDDSAAFLGTFAASFAFFRDTRLGNSQTARPGTAAATHLTGIHPTASNVIKRVQVAAGIWTRIPLIPGFVLANPTPTPAQAAGALFGVFSETLNEALDVMVDCYERILSPSEQILPQ